MQTFTDKGLIHKFLPYKGIPWSEFRTGSATRADPSEQRAGVYVFTTYQGHLVANSQVWGAGQVPRLAARKENLATVEALIVSNAIEKDTLPTVIYAGRSTSRSIAERLGDYVRGSESQCKPELLYLLETYPDDIYVRWTDAFHWETSLINRYRPQYNKRQANPAVDVGSAQFHWEGRMTWYQCLQNLNVVPKEPGLYAFTSPLANQMLNVGHVWYIGEAGDLRERMRAYSRGKAVRKSQEGFVTNIINEYHASKFYLRWTRNLIFENEIIRVLQPCYNIASRSFDEEDE